jgi:hypothetical protein
MRLAAGFATPHPEIPPLLGRLLQAGAEFRELWDDHNVAGLSVTNKIIGHPAVGRIDLTYQSFDVRQAPGQLFTVATAPVSTSSADKLAILGTIYATSVPTANTAYSRHQPSTNGLAGRDGSARYLLVPGTGGRSAGRETCFRGR